MSPALLPTVAVVVPVLNEAAVLPSLLHSLAHQTQPAEEVVVVDGGSTDETTAIARDHGASLLTVPGRGRGGQVAAAVAMSTADVVLVLHADMLLPGHALAAIREHLARHLDCPGGCLGHRFDHRTPLLRLVEWWDWWRARRGESYGDQAQFFRRELLDRVGGFPDQPLMEDVELAVRLRRLGTPVYLDVPVTVSARRFERLGVWKTTRINRQVRRRYRREGPSACQAIFDEYYRQS